MIYRPKIKDGYWLYTTYTTINGWNLKAFDYTYINLMYYDKSIGTYRKALIPIETFKRDFTIITAVMETE